MTRLGLVVNPIAGMGGRAGLHGSDGLTSVPDAGSAAGSASRTRRALLRVGVLEADIEIVTAPGAMGADICSELGLPYDEIGAPATSSATTAADTAVAVARMVDAGVDLVMFAGGDGTARDVAAVTGTATAILGIPSGVKMRSGVFAVSPEAAGSTASSFLRGERITQEADVVDLVADESGTDVTRHFGSARVPSAGRRMQRLKAASSTPDDAELAALCRDLAATLDDHTLYLFGPGSTTKRIGAELGWIGTPLGVDATRGRDLVGRDLSEAQLLELLRPGTPAVLFLGVLGGQGFLLGRGNQQLSPAVIARIGHENVVVLASQAKIAGLSPSVLWLDVGDEQGERVLPAGYRRVLTGPGREMVVKVAHAGDEKEFDRAI